MGSIDRPARSKTGRSRPGRAGLVAVVAGGLRREIISGRRPPGSKLSEPSVAKQRGISRGPVREALRQLEREGLVEFDAVGRSRVVTMDAADFEDIVVVRAALESAAAAHVAGRFDPPIHQALAENIAALAAATTLAEVSRLDLAFHERIMEASGRRRLVSAWRAIRSPLALWLGTLHRTREAIAADVLAETVRSHRGLLELLAGGDAALAAEAAARHAGGLGRWASFGAGDA